MHFAGGRNDPAAKNFRDDLPGLAGAIDAKIGQLIGRQALRMELPKADFIAKERAAGHGHAASEQDFDGRIEPKDGHSGGAKKFGAALLGVRAAAESENRAFAKFSGAAEGSAKLIGFELAEGRLAVAFEKLRDADASGGFDAVIEVDKAPAKLAGQQSADSGLAGTHESGEGKDGKTWRLRHQTRNDESPRGRPRLQAFFRELEPCVENPAGRAGARAQAPKGICPARGQTS